MAELHVIHAESPISPDVIEHLTFACKQVETDQVSAVAIAMLNRDGSISTVWSRTPSMPALLGGVERLKHRIQRSMDED